MFVKILGILSNVLQWNIGGPKIKNSAGVLENRNAADTLYNVMRGGKPLAADDFVTKDYSDVSGAGVVHVILVTTTNVAGNFDSATQLPNNARVVRSTVDVTTAYDGTGTISVGIAGTVAKFQAASEVDPSTIGMYQVEQDTLQTPAAAVRVTVGGTSPTGVARVLVYYIFPNP